jgi:hypothetical protein
MLLSIEKENKMNKIGKLWLEKPKKIVEVVEIDNLILCSNNGLHLGQQLPCGEIENLFGQ